MTKVLALDTALGGCSVGVLDGDRLLASRQVETPRDQAKLLVPLIGEALEEAGFGYPDIELIVSTVGPGSFTGLRLGLSTARALALALDRPAVGVSTLEVMAQDAAANGAEGEILAVLETKRTDFYVQRFDGAGTALSKPMALEMADMQAVLSDAPVTLIGDALTRFGAETAENMHVSREMHRVLTDPAMLGRVGMAKAQAGKVGGLDPVYLRGADVSRPKTPPRQIATNS